MTTRLASTHRGLPAQVVSATVAVAGFAFCPTSGTSAAERRPDVVIFLTDDHSRRDATPYSSTTLRTPNMQRLADAGMTFTRAYASPTCAPSRVALMRGMMPPRNGAEANQSKPRIELEKWLAYIQALGYGPSARPSSSDFAFSMPKPLERSSGVKL
jgi:uncharacterized sulfatase